MELKSTANNILFKRFNSLLKSDNVNEENSIPEEAVEYLKFIGFSVNLEQINSNDLAEVIETISSSVLADKDMTVLRKNGAPVNFYLSTIPNNMRVREYLSTKVKLKEAKTVNAITMVEDIEVMNYVANTLSTNAPITRELTEDMLTLIEYLISKNAFDYSLLDIKIKEIGSLFNKKSLDNNWGILFFDTVTDVLRFAFELSNMELGEKRTYGLRFRFGSAKRKLLCKTINNILESKPFQIEDMKRWRNEWIRLIKALHPSDKYQHFYKAAGKLMHEEKSIRTFNSRIEELFTSGKHKDMIKLLSSRKGDFALQINKMISYFNEEDFKELLEQLKKTDFSIKSIIKLLSVMGLTPEYRIVFPKGNTKKSIILDRDNNCVNCRKKNEYQQRLETIRKRESEAPISNNLADLLKVKGILLDNELTNKEVEDATDEIVEIIEEIVEDVIEEKVSEKSAYKLEKLALKDIKSRKKDVASVFKKLLEETVEKKEEPIFIEDEDFLSGVKAPLTMRNTPDGKFVPSFGSTLKFDDNNLRMWIYWEDFKKCPTDIDLSVELLNNEFENVGQVSYTNTQFYDACLHSGDYTSAPEGATEFIDFDRKKMLKNGVRYLVMSIHAFSSHHFSDGVVRCGVSRTGKKMKTNWVPSNIKMSFDLNNDATSAIPIMFDLETGEMIWINLSHMSRRGANSIHNTKTILEAKTAHERSKSLVNAMDIVKIAHENILTKEDFDKLDEENKAKVRIFNKDNFDFNQFSSEYMS